MGKEKGGQGSGKGKMRQLWETPVSKSKRSQTKIVKKTCRVCKEEITSQNYGRHLREVHPEEWEKRPGDIRAAGERELSFYRKESTEDPFRERSPIQGRVNEERRRRDGQTRQVDHIIR